MKENVRRRDLSLYSDLRVPQEFSIKFFRAFGAFILDSVPSFAQDLLSNLDLLGGMF